MPGFTHRVLLVTALVAAVSVLGATAVATPLVPDAAKTFQGQGLAVAEGGVGLRDLGGGSRNITVAIGGPVQKAYLYWAGRNTEGCPDGACFNSPNVEPFGDQRIVFGGTPLTGTIVGREYDSIAYRSDVTGIIQAAGTGVKAFSISDGDLSKNLTRLDGAGLIVVYTNPSDALTYRVMIADGLDFAYGGSSALPSPDNATTSPVSFSFGASPTDRNARLILFTGDGDSARADRVDISNNSSILGSLDGTDGDAWDSDSHPITVPASATSTTVHVSSPAGTREPDSLTWILAALRVPVTASSSSPSPTTSPSPSTSPSTSPSPTASSPAPPGGNILHGRWITLSTRHRDGRLVLRGLLRAADGFGVCHDSMPVSLARKTKLSSWTPLGEAITTASGFYRRTFADQGGKYRAYVALASIDGQHSCGAATSTPVLHRH